MILLLPTHLISKNINESILVIVHSNAIFVTLLPHNLEVWKTINLPMSRPKKLSNAKYATIQLQDRDTWSSTKKVFLISTEKNLYNKLSKEKDKRPCLVVSRLKWLRFKKTLYNRLNSMPQISNKWDLLINPSNSFIARCWWRHDRHTMLVTESLRWWLLVEC